MSNEQTSSTVKRILIAVIAVSICAVGAFVLLMTYPAGEYRAAKELELRGFLVDNTRQSYNVWAYPRILIGENLSITEDDSRLIGQLSHLQDLVFRRCDLSGLNLDDIGNCQELIGFSCDDVTPFPADEIRKLAACPVHRASFVNASLDDSDLADFAKWIRLQNLYLNDNVEITDTGFDHLEKIASLKYLILTGASVTQERIEEFKKKRPDVEVEF